MGRSCTLLLGLATAALAQDQRPLPAASPELIVGRSVPVHVVASEELEPDVLRALARPGVTLWLTTRSNTLRESTLDTLKRFETSWVQLRLPLAPVDGNALARAPRAGLWLAASPELKPALSRYRASRPLALELEGALDADLHALVGALRPTFSRWRPADPVDLLQWSRFRSLPGRKTVVLAPGLLVPQSCDARSPVEPSAELHVATLLAVSAGVFPCGAGTRVEVLPEVEPWLLKSLIVRDPSVELVVNVGDEVRKVGKTRALLELLGR
ncbi:MAG: hypothetical protein JNJ54_27060 [Myxococcaceae bacterium]|nr:hypothetical protein [Myxococcaceae bacterium]